MSGSLKRYLRNSCTFSLKWFKSIKLNTALANKYAMNFQNDPHECSLKSDYQVSTGSFIQNVEMKHQK